MYIQTSNTPLLVFLLQAGSWRHWVNSTGGSSQSGDSCNAQVSIIRALDNNLPACQWMVLCVMVCDCRVMWLSHVHSVKVLAVSCGAEHTIALCQEGVSFVELCYMCMWFAWCRDGSKKVFCSPFWGGMIALFLYSVDCVGLLMGLLHSWPAWSWRHTKADQASPDSLPGQRFSGISWMRPVSLHCPRWGTPVSSFPPSITVSMDTLNTYHTVVAPLDQCVTQCMHLDTCISSLSIRPMCVCLLVSLWVQCTMLCDTACTILDQYF